MNCFGRGGLVAVAGLALCASASLADVYPSSVKVPDADRLVGPAETATVQYILNENADTGVTVEVIRACDGTVVRTVNVGPQARGPQTFVWDKMTDAATPAPDGSYRFRITAADDGHGTWEVISNDPITTSFYYPSGVAVNKRADSEYYGRIYVTHAGTTTTKAGRTMGRGLYLLNADLSDAVGQGNTARTGGVTWNASTASPMRPEVGPDDRVYIADWSDPHSGLWVADPDITAAVPAIADVAPIASTGLSALHGSISDSVVVGTGINRTLYTADEDYLGFGVSGTGSKQGSVWKYLVGNVTPTFTAPVVQYDDAAAGNLNANYRNSLALANDGTWWMTQDRDAGTDLASLWQFAADGTLLWDSKTAFGPLSTTNRDPCRQTRGMAYDAKYNRIALATYRNGGSRDTSEGLVIIFDPVTKAAPTVSFRMDPDTTIGYVYNSDAAFDAVGNVYVTSIFVNTTAPGNPGVQRLRVFSPPTGPNSSATTSVPFTLSSSGAAIGPVLSGPADVSACLGGGATLTVSATGNGPFTYRWFENGVEMSGQTGPSISYPSVTPAYNGLTYQVQVCDANGLLSTSRTATLSVGDVPFFTKAPSAAGAWVGDSATFTATAISRGAPPQTLSYQWYKKPGDVMVVNGPNVSGANTATLTLSNVTLADAAQYYVVAADPSCGGLTTSSAAAVLNVLGLPCPRLWADGDKDGDVDLADFGVLQACLFAGAPFSDACKCLNHDVIGDSANVIDMADLAAFLVCASGPTIPAAPACGATILFQDNFDDTAYSALHWVAKTTDDTPGTDNTVTFGYDYSAVAPPAPNSNGTSKGLFVSVNDVANPVATVEQLEAALAVSTDTFSGDYTLQFDMWQQVGGTSTTEMAAYGVDADVSQTLVTPTLGDANGNAVGPIASGYMFANTGESGDNWRDYREYEAGAELTNLAGFINSNQDALVAPYPSYFPAPKSPQPGTPGNTAKTNGGWGWVRVTITQKGGNISLSMNGNPIASRALGAPNSGSIMLGQMDLYSSVNNKLTYSIFDNVLVTAP